MISFDDAGRAVTLIASISAAKETHPGFWPMLVTRIVTDLDIAGDEAAVTMIARLLAALRDQLEDKPVVPVTATGLKVRDNRLRRIAGRQGLRVIKSRARDPLSPGFGRYRVVTADGEEPERFASPGGWGLTPGEAERRLCEPAAARALPCQGECPNCGDPASGGLCDRCQALMQSPAMRQLLTTLASKDKP